MRYGDMCAHKGADPVKSGTDRDLSVTDGIDVVVRRGVGPAAQGTAQAADAASAKAARAGGLAARRLRRAAPGALRD